MTFTHSVCTFVSLLTFNATFFHSSSSHHSLSHVNLFLCVSSIFLQYTEELLRQQQFLEVYLEGTRSRSGKPSTARAGMLSIVVDTLFNGSIADVLVVPVGISYDRIIEGNYNSEQLVSAWMMPVVCLYFCFGNKAVILSHI